MYQKNRTTLVRKAETVMTSRDDDGYVGLSESILIGEEQGSVHQEFAMVELAAGGKIPGHYHPFEESFLILSGEVFFAMSGFNYQLRAGDYGVAPIATPHAWQNLSSKPARWIRIRAPQPKQIGDMYGVYPYRELVLPTEGKQVDLGDPLCRNLGHFDWKDMPPYGPIATRGISAPTAKRFSVRMIVDDIIGAQQHVVFMGEQPRGEDGKNPIAESMPNNATARSHFHQFEEIYHFFSGRALASLGGDIHEIEPGDTILTGVGSSHGVFSIGDEPMRWIETMTPRPPERDALFWERDWLNSDYQPHKGQI